MENVHKISKCKGKKSWYRVEWDNIELVLHEDLIVECRIVPGSSWSSGEIAELERRNRIMQGSEQAIRWLKHAARSEHEIMQRLQRAGYEEQEIAEMIARCKRLNYLDDRQYAKEVAHSRVSRQKKGQMWVKQELRYRGVGSEEIAEAVASIDPAAEQHAAMTLAMNRWKKRKSDSREEKVKVAQYLMRRGYTQQLVWEIIRALPQGPEIEEEWN